MKQLTLIALITTLTACSDPIPVNAEAVKHCLDKDMIPYHYSSLTSVKFTCEDKK